MRGQDVGARVFAGCGQRCEVTRTAGGALPGWRFVCGTAWGASWDVAASHWVPAERGRAHLDYPLARPSAHPSLYWCGIAEPNGSTARAAAMRPLTRRHQQPTRDTPRPDTLRRHQ